MNLTVVTLKITCDQCQVKRQGLVCIDTIVIRCVLILFNLFEDLVIILRLMDLFNSIPWYDRRMTSHSVEGPRVVLPLYQLLPGLNHIVRKNLRRGRHALLLRLWWLDRT